MTAVKEVEWIGGPFDGRVDALPEEAVVIRIALPTPFDAEDPTARLALEYDLPIKRRPDGRFYVLFRYPDWL